MGIQGFVVLYLDGGPGLKKVSDLLFSGTNSHRGSGGDTQCQCFYYCFRHCTLKLKLKVNTRHGLRSEYMALSERILFSALFHIFLNLKVYFYKTFRHKTCGRSTRSTPHSSKPLRSLKPRSQKEQIIT